MAKKFVIVHNDTGVMLNSDECSIAAVPGNWTATDLDKAGLASMPHMDLDDLLLDEAAGLTMLEHGIGLD